MNETNAYWYWELFNERRYHMPLNPATDMLINALIIAIFSALKASGMSEEEAKAQFQAKVAQVEQLPQLPMDI